MGLVAVANADTISFDDAPAGQPPPGWTAGVTGKGSPHWSVEADESAVSAPHVLKQTGKGTYPWCVLNEVAPADGLVEVRFKPVAGKEDQAAGIVWRFQDADNYYVCRANALENNVVLYKVKKGRRTPLGIVGRKGGYGVRANVPRGQWSTLRVEFNGPRFAVLLNGERLFEVEDDTFTAAGQIGLWTKADSVTLFDDFWFGK